LAGACLAQAPVLFVRRRVSQAAFCVGWRGRAPRRLSFTFFDQSIEYLRFY
jgi:hypothetical protein